ncbi:MAG: SufE family protein [bacterium]
MTRLDRIIEDFKFLPDWDSRYQHLVELGEQLPPLLGEFRIEDNRVKGCMSTVYVHPQINVEDGLVYFQGDCDTAIIKGVLAVLINLLSARTPEQIQQFDVDEFFTRMQLAEHLSPNRHFGIYAIVELMKGQVGSLAERVS